MRNNPLRAWRPALVAWTVAVAVLSTAGTSLAAGGSTPSAYQPDARISEPCHHETREFCQTYWFGDDIYNTTARGQTARYADYPNFYDVVTTTFKINIQNDGDRTDRYRVGAMGKTAGFRVKFFAGTTDVTADIAAGTFRTPWLAPRETYLIKAKVKPVTPNEGDKTNRLVTITSRTDPTKHDAVKFVRTYIEMVCGC